ncbi:LysM peptidoglycan-binding domain-containing protein [Limosilactobacillus reuteri]|uniref:LysM peptidoglycan-binding domain-containing protein n=1 Tax=Limosilactobacillus reuteri TaxID=1598 RepID=UPI001E5AD5B6|nr:LysM domain-containing protein [Limosilactobacillus reuteri]MCC4367970.1 LysM peptidoglycan-binding domain-containing protein [Limosilactobacillus reuteri]
MKLSKKQLAATLMTAVLAGSVMIGSVATVEADNASGSPEEQADITNWIANTPEQISNNMAMQHINTNNLNGTRYIIQWGDTLSGISAATGISVVKLCYDNNIQNANLIFAGDVLILNREGSVPAGYDPNVNPNVVAQTKITINNGPTTVNIAVQPQSVVKNYDNSDNSDHSTTIYKAGAVNSFNNNDNEQSASQSSSTKSPKSPKHKKHQSSSIDASDIVSGLNDANDNDKLSFDEGDGGSDADELNVDSAAILKDAKKNDYDAILSEIESALGSKAKKDTTIYIEKDGSEIHVYASVNDDDSSNSSSTKDDEDSDSSSSSESESSDDSSQSSSDDGDSSSQSSSDDGDSSSQATTSDHDTDTSDDE